MHHEMFKQNNEHVQLENPHGEETPNGIYVCFALQYCTSFLHWDISSYNHALASIRFGALSTPSFSPSWLLALKFGSLTLIFNNGSKLQYALACGSCLHLLMIILIQLIYQLYRIEAPLSHIQSLPFIPSTLYSLIPKPSYQ